ncbi:dATP/dGTP pyrophosphohydrolase domain-containing protein, partial [Salmonella enterica]
ALASLEAKPIGYMNCFTGRVFSLDEQPGAGTDTAVYEPVYAAPPAPERERIRREHAEWSDATFGNVGPIGPLKHLSKEAMEAAADPSDPLEWADMQFLLWDAQRRAGISDGEITAAMEEKLKVNMARQWPEPKDGEPRLHIKEQPAPVVPEDISGIIERFQYQADHLSDWHHIDEHSCKVNRRDLMTALEFMDSCRAAMLQGTEPVSQTYKLPELIEGMEVSIDVSTCDADAGNRYFGTVTEVSELDTAKNGYILLVQDAEPNFKTAGNSPVTPDGWISCSERMPDNDEDKPIAIFTGNYLGQGVFVAAYDDDGFFDFWEGGEIIGVTHWMPLPEPPQEVK